MLYKILTIALWAFAISLFVEGWPFELFVSFLMYAIGIGLVLIVLFWKKFGSKRLWPIIPLVVMLIFPASHMLKDAPQYEGQDEVVRLYSHNILYKADNGKIVGEQAERIEADIVGVQEALPEHVRQIQKEVGYEHAYISDCDCSRNDDELGLVSRYPIVEAETDQIDVLGGRMINSLIDINGTITRVIILHLPVPITPSSFSTRERGFDSLSKRIHSSKEPTIVMGDFNTTLWSKSLRSFSESVSDVSYNVADGKWPTRSWCGGSLQIACLRIDHIFVDNSMYVEYVKVDGAAGSDHHGLLAEVKL